VAAYRHYLKYKTDDKGVTYEINDPWLTPQDLSRIASDNLVDFLELSPFQCTDWKRAKTFVEKYVQLALEIQRSGIIKTLESFILSGS
jgi:mannitol 2-dehydrogenase